MYEEHVLETALGLKPLTKSEKDIVRDIFSDAAKHPDTVAKITMKKVAVKRSPLSYREFEVKLQNFVNERKKFESAYRDCINRENTLAGISVCVSKRFGDDVIPNGLIDMAGGVIRDTLRVSKVVEF